LTAVEETPEPDVDFIRAQVEGGAEHWEFEEGDAIAPGRTVVEPLGGGTRYDVYLVWDDRLLALAVAKVLRPDRVNDENARRRFQRETRLAHRLAHPVIVRGLGSDPDGPAPHFLLEHIDGPTLMQLIEGPRVVALEQLLPLVVDVGSALHYLAIEEIVHLDVKPSNVVVAAPAKMIDLSMARSFERAAQVRRPIGTDPYMSPEQCDPQSLADRIGTPSDVWALGATFFHAATGQVPFPRPPEAAQSDDLTVRFPQLVADPVQPRRPLPPPLDELVMAMLARDPADRPEPGEVVYTVEPLVATPPRRPKMRRRFRRGRW
jgi:serine/threonine protein kinase